MTEIGLFSSVLLSEEVEEFGAGFLAGGAGAVEVAVGEFGGEGGEGGAGGGAGGAHAHEAERAGGGVGGGEAEEGEDVGGGAGEEGEFGEGVGGEEEVFEEGVEGVVGGGAGEVVVGEDDGFVEGGGEGGEGGAEGAFGFDVDGVGGVEGLFEEGEAVGFGVGPVAAVAGEAEGGDDGDAEGAGAFDGAEGGGEVGEVEGVEAGFDDVATGGGVGWEGGEGSGGEDGADDAGGVEGEGAEVEGAHGAGCVFGVEKALFVWGCVFKASGFVGSILVWSCVMKVCLLVCWLVCAGVVGGMEPARTWTDVQGRMISAVMLEPGAESVRVRLMNGVEHTIPLDRLVEADRQYVRRRLMAMVASGELTGVRLPPAQRRWPESVGVSPTAVEATVVEENAAERRYVYHTEDFEFVSDEKLARSVMTEVARTFEATRTLLLALPWGLRCIPPAGQERYRSQLFETREGYVAAGAPENSGGVYMSGPKLFMVPFQSLGLRKRAQTWYQDRAYSNDTLIHEITHQLMDELLMALPLWVIEGTAEYVENLPYNAGTFRAHEHHRALRANLAERERRGLALRIDGLERFLRMTREEWHAIADRSWEDQASLYIGALLAVYYFNHLDGDGTGTRFMAFMDAVHDDVDRRAEIFADPRVEHLPNGGWRMPSGLLPPELGQERMPFNHVGVLLGGRSVEQLAGEMEAGFRGAGLKVVVTP